MVRLRVKKKKRNYHGPNIFTDKRVSLFSKGLFAIAREIAQREKGIYDISKLMKIVPADTDDIYKGFMELRKLGYCKRVTGNKITEFILTQSPRPSYARSRADGPDSELRNKRNTLFKSIYHVERIDDPEEIEVADWDEIDPTEPSVPVQQSLLPVAKAKKLIPRPEPIVSAYHHFMYRLCFMVENEAELRVLSSVQRGKVASVLGQLNLAGANLSLIPRFHEWWDKNWRSKSSTGVYQPPRPDQVLEHWVEATKALSYIPKRATLKPEVEMNLHNMMLNRAKGRKQ